jgi:hypothetical protein
MARELFRVGEVESDRVEAFSDGMLAIVITLLVLDLHVPRVEGDGAAFWQALIDPHWSRHALRQGMKRSLIAPALYFLGMIPSLVWTPLAVLIQVLVPVIFFLPSRAINLPIETEAGSD